MAQANRWEGPVRFTGLGAEFSIIQVEPFTGETWEVGRVLTEDGSRVGAVVSGPLLEEVFGRGRMGSVVEAEALKEDSEVDIDAEPLGVMSAHDCAGLRPVSSRWSIARDGRMPEVVGPTGG